MVLLHNVAADNVNVSGRVCYLKRVWIQVFFMNQCPPGPFHSIPLGPFWIFSKICGDIHEWIFIAGVNNTGDKLFSGVNDTGEKFIAGVVDTGY